MKKLFWALLILVFTASNSFAMMGGGAEVDMAADPWAGPVEIWEAALWMAQAQVRPKDTRIITDGPGPAKTHIASACGQPSPFNFLGWDVMADLTPSGRNSGKGENSVDKSQRIRIVGATDHGLSWCHRLSLKVNSWRGGS